MKINSVILNPIVSEKTTTMAQRNIVTFAVDEKVNKYQIKETVEKLYGVEVGKINMMIRKGKTKRVGKRMIKKKTADVKIALVTLTKGSIDLFPKA